MYDGYFTRRIHKLREMDVRSRSQFRLPGL